jgi:hypothetical protein
MRLFHRPNLGLFHPSLLPPLKPKAFLPKEAVGVLLPQCHHQAGTVLPTVDRGVPMERRISPVTTLAAKRGNGGSSLLTLRLPSLNF